MRKRQLTFTEIEIESLPLFSGTPMREPEPQAAKKRDTYQQGDLFQAKETKNAK